MGDLKTDLYVDLDTTELTHSVNASDITHEHAMIEGFEFPLNTDYFLNADNERVMTPGITVYAPKMGKLYISAEAIQMVEDIM